MYIIHAPAPPLAACMYAPPTRASPMLDYLHHYSVILGLRQASFVMAANAVAAVLQAFDPSLALAQALTQSLGLGHLSVMSAIRRR